MSDPIRLTDLPEPDITAPDRIWARFRARGTRRVLPLLLGGCAVATAAAALALVVAPSDTVRSVVVEGESVSALPWSDTVEVTAEGSGTLNGSSDRLAVQWTSGTIEASVTPNTDTTVEVITAEAHVQVVGTVFDVTRDRLGTAVHVSRGTVHVACDDGYDGLIHAGEERVCLPVSAAGLLGRAEALVESGAEGRVIVESLDRGVRMADHDAVLGELLVLRMQTLSQLGEADDAVADARQYLALAETPRREQVQRFAGWTTLQSQGCDAAIPWLTPLADAGAGAETVLLAECLEQSNPEAARQAVERALPALEPAWSDRAMRLLARLGD